MKKQQTSLLTRISMLTLILVILTGLLGVSVQTASAASGSLKVVSVKQNKTVTVTVTGMPANTVFNVRISASTATSGGMLVGTARTNNSGTFTATFTIPAKLKDQSTLIVRAEARNNTLWNASSSFSNAASSAPTSGTTSSTTTSTPAVPSGSFSSGNITINDIEEDKSVEITVTGAPANSVLTVFIDWENRGGALKGVKAGTIKSNGSGKVNATIKLPSAASDRGGIRVRVEGPNFLAYKWALNAGSDSDTGGSAAASYTGGIPYIVVVEVVPDDMVTIEIHNLPKGTYDILMDETGNKGKNGIDVDTIKLTSSSTRTVTIDIPDDLEGEDEIAIRVENVDESSYYAYTWFDND
jgi:hypothetical protein